MDSERDQRGRRYLRRAILRQDGHTLQLLENSTTYTPFFLEPPDLGDDVIDEQRPSIDAFFDGYRGTFLPGGYLYRIRFPNAAPLYMLSSGDSEEHGWAWYSSLFRKKLEIDSFGVWAGGERDVYSYATLLAGSPPRLVVYDKSGSLLKEMHFNLPDPGLESKIADAVKPYERSGRPTLEMVSISEYLSEEDVSWRKLRASSGFNFKNQHKAPEEAGYLRGIQVLTREEAIAELQLRLDRAGGR